MHKYLTLRSLFVLIVFWLITSLFLQIVMHITEVSANENTVIIIRSQQIKAYNKVIEGFKRECKERNIFIEGIFDLKGDIEKGKKIIQNIKADNHKPDLIMAVGTLAAVLTKTQFTNIPIIFCMVIYHERFDLQGTNITGISTEVPVEDQFTFLEELLGTVRNVGVIYDPSKTGNVISKADPVAKKFKFKLIKAKITSNKEVTSALKKINNQIDALWIIPDSTVITRDSLGVILETALECHLPTFCTSSSIVKKGAMASISPDYTDIGIKVARMAQTLLNSSTVISLGIQQPDKFKLFLNIQTAKKIGIDISSIKLRPNVVLYP
jgi:putative ABC transport system substrate-binding protein